MDDVTIVAVATPPGSGGVGIVRLSGPQSLEIAKKMIGPASITPRYAHFVSFKDQTDSSIDQGILLYFKAPHSFTGEDVVECHLHGSPFVLRACVETALYWGARGAHPGEFSQRAFLNGKIDLAQAEAIKDLIHANSMQAAKSAIRSLSGEFSLQVNQLLSEVTHCRMFIEASIDFSDEDISFLEEEKMVTRVRDIYARCQKLLENANYGVVLNDGFKVGLAGAPNAGKSSLLNALAQEDVAIVTDIPGTTRDLLSQTIQLGDITLDLVDTAGLREAEDAIEIIGIARAKKALKDVDLILYLVDAAKDILAIDAEVQKFVASNRGSKVLVVLNKIDAISEIHRNAVDNYIASKNTCMRRDSSDKGEIVTWISSTSLHGEGLNPLKDALKAHWLKMTGAGQGHYTARLRHVKALEQASSAALEATQLTEGYFQSELVAHCLSMVQKALGEITGEFRADDLLGKIFAEFCIGK